MKTKPILGVVIIGGVIWLSNYPGFIMEHIITPGQLIIYLVCGIVYLAISERNKKQREIDRINKDKESSRSLMEYIGRSETFDVAQSFKRKRIRTIKK